MENCIFCKIGRGEIPSKKVYEDESVLAFQDINAQAPVHVLIIPKKHIGSLLELTEADEALSAHIFRVTRGQHRQGWRADGAAPPFPSAGRQRSRLAPRLKCWK